MDLKESGLVDPTKHWYYISKAAAIKADISKFAQRPLRVIDIGAGSGYFSSVLVDDLGAIANCVDTEYTKEYMSGSISFTKTPTMEDPNVYLFIDVLEHVSDPIELLQMHLASTKKGDIVVISVPAFRFLWSVHDEFLGHFDRYKVPEACSWLGALRIDFEILRKHYLFSVIFPAVLAIRKLPRSSKSDLRQHNKVVNEALRIFCTTENVKVRNKLFGLSSYVVARVL